MALSCDQLICTETTALQSPAQFGTTRVHPLLEQFASACKEGDLTQLRQTLNQLPITEYGNMPHHAIEVLQRGLQVAVERRDSETLQLLLGHGFIPYSISCLAVDSAFKRKDTDLLKLFVDNGWDVNEAGPELNMRPLLRHAVTPEYDQVRAFLLAHGASPHTENERRLTPLETAVQWSPLHIFKELLEHGDARSDDSLIAAVEAGNLPVVELLVDRGADVNQLEKQYPDPWGQRKRRTVLDAALLTRRKDMVVWLLQKGAKDRNYSNEDLQGV